MNEILINEKEDISSKIYVIRGVQVMLDSDLAQLYECANGTKSINLAVSRHKERFPKRFMFQLTSTEYYEILRFKHGTLDKKYSRFQIETTNKNILRFQSETLELKQGKYSKYLPYVFTEQGVAMLATVLRTSISAEISIRIMDAFVSMRQYISYNIIEQKYINNLVLEDHDKINALEKVLWNFEENQKVDTIFYNGQIYDAYSLLMDILNKATKEIIIIDNYAAKELLDILKNIDRKIIIISKNIDEILIKKYKKQYTNVEFIKNDIFHDRFIIIDKKYLYNCGSSFKDLGKKCFAINEMNSKEILNNLLKRIKINDRE